MAKSLTPPPSKASDQPVTLRDQEPILATYYHQEGDDQGNERRRRESLQHLTDQVMQAHGVAPSAPSPSNGSAPPPEPATRA